MITYLSRILSGLGSTLCIISYRKRAVSFERRYDDLRNRHDGLRNNDDNGSMANKE